ncbi:MAG: hypothetical protein JNK81_05425, partial [Anaerolineales bacterium]|nr:hypothetical protein [Anaerolineales bacterium]
MNKRYFLKLIPVIVLVLLGCTLVSRPDEYEYCPVDKLLLEESDYPSGTIFEDSKTELYREPKESIAQTSYYGPSWISQGVIYYFSPNRAENVYNRHKKSIFSDREVTDSWEDLPTFLNNDTIFDEYEVACGNIVGTGHRCYMIGRYQNYFIMYWAEISDAGITRTLFSELVLKINNKLMSCLNF